MVPADFRRFRRSAAPTSWRATPAERSSRATRRTNFTATWESGGNVSWIDVSISSDGPDRAQLVVEHIVDVDDENWREFGPGAVGMGWDSMLLGLAIYLGTGEAIDPSFGQQWMVTEDGRRFLTLSGEEWYTANVASGEDPATSACVDRSMHQGVPRRAVN